MGKKKLSLKPVNRGFATTSVASKKQVADAAEEAKAKEHGEGATAQQGSAAPTASASGGEDGARSAVARVGDGAAASKEDWEDEGMIEQAMLQGLVDRLQDKGDKEVSRVIKGIEYDQRLSSGYSSLSINTAIRDQVLDLALQEENDDGTTDDHERPVARLTVEANADKALMRLFVAYAVLRRLGFSESRVGECLVRGLREGEGWEKAIEWMWLHLTEDECRQQGEYAPQPEETLIEESDAPLLPASQPNQALLDVPSTSAPASSIATPARSATPDAAQEATSLFQSMDATSDSDDSGTSSEPDMSRANTEWAGLMLRLDNLRIAAGGSGQAGSKGKGKKGKGSSVVVIETPEMRALKERIGKVEKEYLFGRKEADGILKTLKARRDAETLQAKLSGRDTKPPSADDVVGAISGDEEEGSLFGNMLDEPPPPDLSTSRPDGPSGTSTATTLTIVRSMPIPKQVAYAGITPKALLRTTVLKHFKSAVLIYVPLSGDSRAARAGLEIRLEPKRRKVWKMEDIACESMVEAENYVSTLALHQLDELKLVPVGNTKTLPPAYRDLWEELEADKKKRGDEGRRKVWKVIKDIYDSKVSESAAVEYKVDEKPDQVAMNGIKNGSQADVARDPFDQRLQSDYARRRSSARYGAMLSGRNSLPIASFRQQILDTLDSSQILVLSGETGCGKSTQLPAYILEDQLSRGLPCKIYVTEPRRISAISLAQRVSLELGDAPGQMGTSSSLVGYSIRLEAKVSPATRLAFVTNGIALRMLEAGSSPAGGGGKGKGTAFDEVTHIIVDEVHERSIESDFLLIVLRQLMEARPDLKVVLMSATLDADQISNYFGGCPVLSVPGRTFPVQVNYLEDAIELAQWHIEEGSPYAIRARNMRSGGKQLEYTEDHPDPDDSDENDSSSSQGAGRLSAARYSSKTVDSVNLLDSRQIPYDLIVRLLEVICLEKAEYAPFSAAVLVFMPGLAEIRRLNDLLTSHPVFGSAMFMVYPLHSTISSEGQSAVFDIPPPGVRKIVISTNIAETGVTIPDITCVIDSGKHREMRYDEKRQISRLVETYIARSNAKQRRGRAGRVREGIAFHLFTKLRHDSQLAEHPIPEILRLSLQDLALRTKTLRLKLGPTIESVLLKALDPPTSLNIQRAISALVEVKALTPVSEEITPMGRLLSKLPMDVHLGKFLLVAAMMRCLDPALTIAATLNSKSPWVTPFGLEQQARTVRHGFSVENNDFFTIVNIFNSWRKASEKPSFVPVFCRKNFVSHQNLQQIEELRQQLLGYLVDSGFVTASSDEKRAISQFVFPEIPSLQARYSSGFRTKFVAVPQVFNDKAEDLPALSAALVSGLYPKLLSIDANGGLKTVTNQQPVSIHPSSVNFKLRPSEFGANYLTFFTIMQSKRLYAWEVGAVDDRALAILCGDQVEIKPYADSIVIDKKLRYRVAPKTILAIQLLRDRCANVFAARLRGKVLSERQEQWLQLVRAAMIEDIVTHEEASIGMALPERRTT